MNGAQLATPADNLKARMALPREGQPREKWLTQLVSGSFYIGAKLSAGWCILKDPANRLHPSWLGAVLPDPGDEQPDKEIIQTLGIPPINLIAAPKGIVIVEPKRRGRKLGSKNKPK